MTSTTLRISFISSWQTPMNAMGRILATSLIAISAVSTVMAEVPEQTRIAIDRIIGEKGGQPAARIIVYEPSLGEMT